MRQLQLTATSSFLPPLPASPAKPSERKSLGLTPVGPFGASLAHAQGTTTLTPGKVDDNAPPMTPVPIPASTPTTASQQYAGMDGVVVWEGVVETADATRPVVFRGEEGWVAVWRGEMPVSE